MKILNHNCANKWQDEKYGKNKRAMNICTKSDGVYRCTACGKEITKLGAK